MIGDTYVMRGEPNATIVDCTTYVNSRNGNPVLTALAIRNSSGQIRVRTVDPNTRIVIEETKSSRDNRRRASRRASVDGTPTYGNAMYV
jgi:hypothetical protein